MKNKIIFNISDLKKLDTERKASQSDVFQPIIRVLRQYLEMSENLYIVDDYFNFFTDKKFITILKETAEGYGGDGYEFRGYKLPEDLMDYGVYGTKTHECIGQAENIEFFYGQVYYNGIPNKLAYVSFENMKLYFKDACEAQINRTPKHEKEIKDCLLKIDAIYDNYIEKRAEYLRMGKCPAKVFS